MATAAWSYNKGDTKRFTARTFHNEGNFARLITDVERYQDDNSDDVKIVVTSMGLKNPDDPASTVKGSELKEWHTLPLANFEVDGHAAPQESGKNWEEFASAVFAEDVTPRPRKVEVDDDGKMTGKYHYDGEEIDSDDYEDCLAQSVDQAGEKAVDVIQDPSVLVGRGYFTHIKRSVSKKNGKTYTNQYAKRSELPEWWELETENFVVEGKASSSDNGASKKSKKKTSKRSTKKKTSKKKTSRRRK